MTPEGEKAVGEFNQIIAAEHQKRLDKEFDQNQASYYEEIYRLAMKVVNGESITKQDIYQYLRIWFKLKIAMRLADESSPQPFEDKLVMLKTDEEAGTLSPELVKVLEERIKNFKPRDGEEKFLDSLRNDIQQNQLTRGFFSDSSAKSPLESAISNIASHIEWENKFTPFTYQALMAGMSLWEASQG